MLQSISLKINLSIYKYMYSAVIIEPRQHKALSFVLRNFLENLSNEWNIIVFHGNLNIDYVNNIVNSDLSQYKERISLINLKIDNMTRTEYSHFLMKNVDFYNLIPTETFLIFQTDTMIFSKNKDLINNFLKYDYVGAPWHWIPVNNQLVGNGGLSLRKKSKMLDVIEKSKYTYYSDEYCEDIFFCWNSNLSLYKPSKEEAKLFAVEYAFSEITFGCHQPWILKNLLLPLYPEINELILLNDKQNYVRS